MLSDLCVSCSCSSSGISLLEGGVWRSYCLWCLPFFPGNPDFSAAEFYTRFRPWLDDPEEVRRLEAEDWERGLSLRRDVLSRSVSRRGRPRSGSLL